MAARLLLALIVGLAPALAAQEDWRDDPLTEQARAKPDAEAIELYRQLLLKYPGVTALEGEAAAVYYETQQYETALKLYQSAAAAGWKPERVHIRIGKCFEKLKRPNDAKAAFQRALAVDATSVPAQFGLGTAYFNQNRAAEARPLFETLQRRDDEWGLYAREFAAYCRFDTGDYFGAIALLQDLLSRTPDDAALRWLLARSFYKARRFEEALQLFTAFADDPTRTVAASYYSAVCLESLGRRREAEKRYVALAADPTEWGRESRASVRRLSGNPWRFVLDYSGGYDSNVLQGGVAEQGSGQKDGYNQVYVQTEGRLWRDGSASFWIGGEHFSLLYPELHENDYIQNAARATLNLPGAGPATRFSLDYQLRYAELDYEAYRREHRGSLTVARETGAQKIRITFGGADNRYFGDSRSLSGPDAIFAVDYLRRLPLWDHEVRVRSYTEYRWTNDPTLERLTQRLRLQYRAQVWGVIYGQVEGTVRRDDFAQSDGGGSNRRTDLRLAGEVQFDAQIHRNISINWGYMYESQSSSRPIQEFKRHQVYAGFTVSF